jgi:hypothetical protein
MKGRGMKKIVDKVKSAGWAMPVLALGIAVCGALIGGGIQNAMNKRTVLVKGLAERDVVADLAVWNINVKRNGKDLASLQSAIDSDVAKVRKFLVAQGFDKDEIQNRRLMARDNRSVYSENKNPEVRYSIETGVMVRTKDVMLVDAVSRKMGDLIRQGIQITEDYSGPIYIFNGLNDIKIPMMEQAIKNAREAGRQFAKDSGASLGKIQSANQGVFSIESRDPTDRWSNDEKQSIYKKVRVVSTITFRLR